MLWTLAKRLTLSALLLTWNVITATAQPVVPGAFGYGMNTRAAYGCGGTAPTVIRVTTTADSGAGSFREALLTASPRVVVFERSGTIVLNSDIDIVDPCLTVAGQTAPSPGITIRGAAGASVTAGGLNIYTHDVLLQHIRVRPGDGGPRLPQTAGHDGILMYSFGPYSAYNIVLDHVSVSWAAGKNLNIVTYAPANISIWKSIISEALYRPINIETPTSGNPASLAMLVASTISGITVYQSLFAHNGARNPEVHENAQLHFINNVVYNWGHGGEGGAENYPFASFFYSPVAGPWFADFIGNKYISGPGTYPSGGTPLYAIYTWSGEAGSRVYMSDNAIDAGAGSAVTAYGTNMSPDPSWPSPPVSISGFTIGASSGIEATVLANAGARPNDRDSIDTRIVTEVTARSGNGRVISQTDVGGWPTLAVNTQAFTTVGSPNTVTGSGYTNLELQLQAAATALEVGGGGPAGPADVAAAAGATIVSAAFTGTNGTDLVTGYTSETGGVWSRQTGSTGTFAIATNRVFYNGAATTPSVTLAAGVPLTANYDVIGTARIVTTTNGGYGIWARALPAAGTGYFFTINTALGTADFWQVVADTYTRIGGCAHTFTGSTTETLTIRVRATTKHALIGATQCSSITDNTIAAAGRAGISAYGATDTSATGTHFDSLVVTDLQAAISAPVITTLVLPNGALTATYSQAITVTGGTAPYTWTVSAGALPAGLVLNASTGAITGTPTFASSYTSTILVTDNAAATTSLSYVVLVQPAVSITTTSPLADGNTGASASVTLTAGGDASPYTWALTAGSLPTGMTLASSGILSGTPTSVGLSSFTVRATGALGSTITKALALTISNEEYRPLNRPIARNQNEGVIFRRVLAPVNPTDRVMKGDLWIDLSSLPPVLKMCISATATTAVWAPVVP